MSFERHRAQLYIESLLGSNDPKTFKNLSPQLRTLTLGNNEAQSLNERLRKDSADVYDKAVQSFCEGVIGIEEKRISWGLIKLYYCTFFSLKGILALRGYAILRCGGLYSLKASVGETPYEMPRKGHSNDHEATLNTYKKLYKGSEVLLSNTIDSEEPLQWLMDMRSMVNYKQVAFRDPAHSAYTENFNGPNAIRAALARYLDDQNLLYAFLPDHAALAYPLLTLKRCAQLSSLTGIVGKNKTRNEFLQDLIGRVFSGVPGGKLFQV